MSHDFWKELQKRKQSAAPHVPLIATRHRFESKTGNTKAAEGVGPLPEVFRVTPSLEYVTDERTNQNNTLFIKTTLPSHDPPAHPQIEIHM